MSLSPRLHASRKMVEKYDQLRAQNKITTDEATCLQDEKNSVLGYQSRLRDKLTEAMEKGTGMFRGVPRTPHRSARASARSSRSSSATSFPYLYPKLEMGARPLKGDEAEQIPQSRRPEGPADRLLRRRHRASGSWSRTGPRMSSNTTAPTSPRRCSTT